MEMADKMDQEDEIFEINDFTAVTEFERFTVSLETILHEWQLNGYAPQGSERAPLSKVLLPFLLLSLPLQYSYILLSIV